MTQGCIMHCGTAPSPRPHPRPLPHTQAPKVVMGPGTGLGAAQLMWDDGQQAYKVWPGAVLCAGCAL